MTYDETRGRPGNLMGNGGGAPLPPPPEREPDRYTCQVTPSLSVATDAAGRVVVEADLALRRHVIPDVATLVVALETARDVGSGGPSAGSLLQRTSDALLTLAEHDRVLGAGLRWEILQVWADLRYGPLPEKQAGLPLSHAARCATCCTQARRLPDRTAVLWHRPGCPEGGGH